MKKLLCPQCNQPMKQISKKSHKGIRNTYRIRRFRCDLCDHTEMIFADGYKDLKTEPRKAIEDVNKQFKQDEANRI